MALDYSKTYHMQTQYHLQEKKDMDYKSCALTSQKAKPHKFGDYLVGDEVSK